MLQRIRRYINENYLLKNGDCVIVGVSGGADSMCLLFILLQLQKELNLTITVLHVNHGIRGKKAEEDEAFVKGFCEEKGLKLIGIHKNVKALSKEWGCSEEEAGRTLRYQSFYEACKMHHCNKIAVAHNKNDNAETILFHLFRGSELHGLTGIPIKRDLVIRPLLDCLRIEIEEYLQKNGIKYRIDETNLEDQYCRNRIRHHIIPTAEIGVNSNVIEHITNTARYLTELDLYMKRQTKEAFEKLLFLNGTYQIEKERFLKEDIVIQRSVIYHILTKLCGSQKDIDSVHVKLVLELLDKQVGKYLNLPYNMLAKRSYAGLEIYNLENSTKRISCDDLPTEYNEICYPCSFWLESIGFYLHLSVVEYKKSMIIPKKRYTKWFDYDKIRNNVRIRSRREGDYFYINRIRMEQNTAIITQGKKSLKSFFIDNKIPREERDAVPLLAEGNHILWVIGDKASESCLVESFTQLILIAELRKDK